MAVLLELFQKNLAYFVTSHVDLSLTRWIEECTYLVAHQFKLKALSQKVIEEFFGFDSRLRPASQANPLFDGLIDELFFGGFGVHQFQSAFGHLVFNLLQLQVALQTAPSDRTLFHFQRRIAKREAF